MIKWESLNSDLLLHIFLRLEPLFLLSTVAFVCRPWGRLCFSRFLTKDGEKTLDLGGLKCDRSGFLFPTGPYGRIGTAGLMKLIRAVMDVYSCDDYDRVDDGDGTRVTPFTKMVFPFGPFVWSDAHLVHVAERYVILLPLLWKVITCQLFLQRKNPESEVERIDQSLSVSEWTDIVQGTLKNYLKQNDRLGLFVWDSRWAQHMGWYYPYHFWPHTMCFSKVKTYFSMLKK